ncbi:MAG: response regulator [Rhodothermales bacterium]|nr:response regulator [Rhodothermales bacterium]
MARANNRLLIVDDNQVDRLKLMRILEADGYVVSVCEDGQGALQLLRTQPFDAVLLDIDMPGMNGYELIAAIRADSALQTIPILAVSALEEADVASKSKQAGADVYLTKDCSPETLKSSVASCLSG